MERIIGDTWSTVKCGANTVSAPVLATVETNLPGFGYKVVGVLGALLGYNLFVMNVTNRTDAWMFLEKMRLYAFGDELVKKGFFMSDAEDAETREHHFQHDADRLNTLWEDAIREATQVRSFDKL